MDINEILNATAMYTPEAFTGPNRLWPDMKEGDWAIRYTSEVSLVYKDGKLYIQDGGWKGTFEEPLPVLKTILNGDAKVHKGHTPGKYVLVVESHLD